MEDIYFFLITFVIIFIILLINHIIKGKKNKLYDSREFILLQTKYKLNQKDIDINNLSLIFVLVNSFIISITATITTIIKVDYIWQVLIGFAILMILIYTIYGLIGKILRKRSK